MFSLYEFGERKFNYYILQGYLKSRNVHCLDNQHFPPPTKKNYHFANGRLLSAKTVKLLYTYLPYIIFFIYY